VKGFLKDEVQDLVWAVVDEYATESQIRRLEQLVTTNDEARRTYITCMQMHADLCMLLGGKPFEPKRPTGNPVRRQKAKKAAPVISAVEADEVAAAMC
jgi:hypothetical protein